MTRVSTSAEGLPAVWAFLESDAGFFAIDAPVYGGLRRFQVSCVRPRGSDSIARRPPQRRPDDPERAEGRLPHLRIRQINASVATWTRLETHERIVTTQEASASSTALIDFAESDKIPDAACIKGPRHSIVTGGFELFRHFAIAYERDNHILTISSLSRSWRYYVTAIFGPCQMLFSDFLVTP